MKKLFCLLMILLMFSVVYAESELTKEQRVELVKNNLDKIDLGKAPKALRFILGKPKINVEINGEVYGFKIAGNKITDFVEGGLEKPHYIVFISEDALDEIAAADDFAAKAEELYLTGKIKIEPQRTGAKIKFWFAKKMVKWFG